METVSKHHLVQSAGKNYEPYVTVKTDLIHKT